MSRTTRTAAAAGLTALSLAVFGLAGSAPAGAVTLASISGTLNDAASGEPITDACVVTAWTADDNDSQVLCTDDLGQWSDDDLDPADTWYIQVLAPNYDEQWANGTDAGSPDQAGAMGFNAPATVNLAVQPTTRFQGTLKRANGTVPPDGFVNIEDSHNAIVGQSAIDSTTGAWLVDVPAGKYRIQYTGDALNLWSPAKINEADAHTYTLADHDVADVDLVVPAAPTGVSGLVTSSATGAPLKGICVVVQPAKHPDSDGGGEVCTAGDGSYAAAVSKAGTYRVTFYDPKGGYAAQIYPHAAAPTSTTVVKVTAGELRSGVNGHLRKASIITGRAIDSLTHQPLADGCGLAYFGHTSEYAGGQHPDCENGRKGAFRIEGLAATSYTVHVEVGTKFSWAPGTPHQSKARLVRLGVGQTKSVGDVTVPPGGRLTGVVTDAKTGKPLKGIWVSTSYAPRLGGPESPYTAKTDSHGHYSISHVVAGVHVFTAWTTHYTEYAPSFGGRASFGAAQRVTVHNGKTAHESFSLVRPAKITGRLVDSAGHAVPGGVVLDAFTATGRFFALGFSSDSSNGVFTITGLPATSVVVQIYHDGAQPKLYYGGATTRAKAKVIHLSAGHTKSITIREP